MQLLTASHPVDAEPRRAGWEYGEPITIADNVWLGGGVIVCPGISIGEDSAVGAGAVITGSLPQESWPRACLRASCVRSATGIVLTVAESREVEHGAGAVDEPAVGAEAVLVVEKDASVAVGGTVSEVRASLLCEAGLRGGYCWWVAGHAKNVADPLWCGIRAGR